MKCQYVGISGAFADLIGNASSADVYFGRSKAILEARKKLRAETLARRRAINLGRKPSRFCTCETRCPKGSEDIYRPVPSFIQIRRERIVNFLECLTITPNGVFCLAFLSGIAVLLASTLARAEGLRPEQETALRNLARGQSIVWTPLDTSQAQEVSEKAERYWEQYHVYHLPHGLNADIIWTDRERTAVEQYKGLGDGAIWTGHYLAALSLRYTLEPGEELRDQMLAILEKMEVLARVSGREGYIARYAGPADDPAYAAYYSQSGGGPSFFRPGLGLRAYYGVPPYESLVWLGDSSRDTYAGFLFGLGAAWTYVTDDLVRDKVHELVTQIGNRLTRDHFFVLDGRGHITLPSLQWRLAWMRLLLSVDPQRFSWLCWPYELWFWLFRLYGLHPRPVWADKYYPTNLDMIQMATTCMLEPEPFKKAAYQEMLRRTWDAELFTHLNPHFAAIYVLCTGDIDERAVATVQGMLLDFPEDKWNRVVDHRWREDIAMRDDDNAWYALLARERPPRDFLWQRPPALAHGGTDEPIEYPGIDMFLPYWMGRVAGALP